MTRNFIYGYVISGKFPNFLQTPVPNDGNCMFTSIALQMGRRAELHLAVREEILNYLKANPVSSVLVKL